MKYSDYSGWIIILDMEPLNDAQASPRKKKKRDSFPQIPTWLEGHVKERKQKRLPTVTLCSSAGNELLEVWYYGDLLTVKGESQSYIIDRGETPRTGGSPRPRERRGVRHLRRWAAWL